MSNDGDGDLLTIQEGAGELRVSERTIWRMIGDGELQTARPGGRRRTLLTRSSVNAAKARAVTAD